MSRDKKDLHSELVTAFENAVKHYITMYPNDPVPFLTYTHRSNDEQNKLYALGRTTAGKIVTNAQAGQSPHNYNPALAFDIAFLTAQKTLSWDLKYFKKFADIILNSGNNIEWGGNFKSIKDPPHFELKAWKTLKK